MDRSGSMAGLESDTIGGFNSMIEKQKKEPGEAFVSTVLFDNVSEVKIDQVVIGSCTNGRMEDMEAAYNTLKGKKIADGVRCIVIPATQRIWIEALELGYLKAFAEAGCVVSTPTCGPCLGGHMGILAKGERAVATTNRNFVGRMGHVESEIYLASPAVAAASAIAGRVVTPDALDVMENETVDCEGGAE